MSGSAIYETALRAIERYGFPMVLCAVVLWFARVDIILPMVDAHQQFLREISETQREITKAIGEQTRLLYALQPRTAAMEAAGDPTN